MSVDGLRRRTKFFVDERELQAVDNDGRLIGSSRIFLNRRLILIFSDNIK